MQQTTTPHRILIIDDDEQVRRLLIELLGPQHDCLPAGSAEEALAILETLTFDLVISDINMEGISGLDLVPQILARDPTMVVVMISGQQTIDFAIEAMRAGAFDYITKPFDLRHVETAVNRALGHHDLLAQQRRYENQLEELVKERTAEVAHLAYHDGLTDLPNRILFGDRCTQALAIAQRNQNQVAVMLVSIDRFKKVTESLGHAAGDVALIEAAARLQLCVASGDTVARFEGEEFALLLTSVVDTSGLADVAQTVGNSLKQSFQLEGQDIYLTVSIGISLFPANGEDVNTILRNAVAALYRAKQQGGNNYQFYAADMNSRALRRLALESSLQRAITNQEFVTYYQPVVNLASGDVVGTEALVRWQHPELGLLPPSQFIPLAEDTGAILELSQLVMRAACTQTRIWQDRGFGRLRIAVNISAKHFQQQDFLERVVDILGETRLDAACLEIELTETSIIENTLSASRLLEHARRLGIKVAIDDFGTGYSSLSYLKNLPIDTVKLDRSFVKGATSDPDDAALVMAIVTLSHNLRLRVIAEGVETEEQMTFLRLLRCDEAQGFLFGKAAAPESFEASFSINPLRKMHVMSNPAAREPRDFREIINE